MIGYENKPFFLYDDPTRIIQILSNLIVNAIKFTNKGEIVVKIRVMEHRLKLKETIPIERSRESFVETNDLLRLSPLRLTQLQVLRIDA